MAAKPEEMKRGQLYKLSLKELINQCKHREIEALYEWNRRWGDNFPTIKKAHKKSQEPA